MEGPAAARVLKTTPAAAHAEISLAGPADDPELRRLLRENPVPGPVALSYEREPDFFRAARVEGEDAQTVVARDPESGRIVGLGSRSRHTAFVNGAERRIGYLGQLRMDRAFRGRPHVVFRGYEMLRELHGRDGPQFYLSTLVDGNSAAQRLLASGHPRLPRYRFLESLRTLVLDVRRIRPSDGRAAGAEDLEGIEECLGRFGRRHQLARSWTAELLRSPDRARGLSIDDFLLRSSGPRVTACAAVWDQSSFKQTIVRGYGPLLRWLRRAAGGLVAPPVGTPLRMACLSHVAVDGDDGGELVSLIRSAAGRARARGIRYLVLGLSARNPLLPVVRKSFAPREYGSRIYVVHWRDGERAVEALDARCAHVEVATL